MSSDASLTAFSYVILALVGEDGAGPHDLVASMRRGRPYWAASPSHFYAEPKRLERLGYLTSTKGPGKTKERTHYRLTDAGRAALREWMGRPTPFPRIQSEAMIRLTAGDFADDATLLESLRSMRTELDEVAAQIDESERVAATLPHRERYLRLSQGLARRIVEAHRGWLDEVERDLDSGRPASSSASPPSEVAARGSG
jgi:DNA-binding PadR family transcriptional regulator